MTVPSMLKTTLEILLIKVGIITNLEPAGISTSLSVSDALAATIAYLNASALEKAVGVSDREGRAP